jgi:hypothetical protein
LEVPGQAASLSYIYEYSHFCVIVWSNVALNKKYSKELLVSPELIVVTSNVPAEKLLKALQMVINDESFSVPYQRQQELLKLPQY